MTPTPDLLAIIRSACNRANPDLLGCTKSLTECGKIPCDDYEHQRPVHLADVLLAINNSPNWKDTWFVTTSGDFFKAEWVGGGDPSMRERAKFGNPSWNLSLPLSQQSNETLQFLAELLK